VAITQAEKKRIKALYSKKSRKTEKQFAAEGIRLLEESLRCRYLPTKVYCADSELSERGHRLVREFKRAGVSVNNLSVRDFSGITETESSQGLLGVFEIPDSKLEALIPIGGRILLLDNISDPGNVGTLFRSALAFGFEAVIMTNRSVDPYNSKVVRSSAGAVFGLPIISATGEEILRFKNNNEFKLIVADIKGIDLNSVRANIRKYARLILALGSEAAGISENLASMADIKIRINHSRKVDSLNVAVAGSIIMKELYR
jgi:TrmH family RNA methyltransferase